MLPRFGSSKLCDTWILVLLVTTVVTWLDGGTVATWFSLAPSRILHGEIWRLVTWPLIEGSPVQLIFTCVAIYKFGGELAVSWGDRRLRRFVLQIVIAAAVLTCVLAIASGQTFFMRFGGWAVTDALVIAWARQYPQRAIALYGLLVVRGRDLVVITVGTTAVFAVFSGPIVMAPELCACILAVAYPRALLRR